MPKDRNLLFVIADGEHARFVRPAEDNSVHADVALDSLSAHERSSDRGSDHPGASYHTGSSAHHALAPHHDPHALEKEKFARVVAMRLNAIDAGGGFDELVIVAPSYTLAVICQHLGTDTNARIIGTLPKDLVKTPADQLWPHLRSWVRPPHCPPM
jgi:protein required for attachment to host cells